MAHSSSISNSDRRPGLFFPWSLSAVAALWIAYAALGNQAAAVLAERLGETLIARTQGRIVDPVSFLHDRFWEAVVLSSLIVAAILLGAWFHRWVAGRVPPIWHWLPLSGYVFLAMNLLLLAAAQTNLFWCGLFVAGPNLKQAAFHAERILMRDSKAPCRILIVGSSQGNSEIASGRLNRAYYPEMQVGNLSYAGAQAFDFLLLQEQYLALRPDAVVCYLSELNLYAEFAGSRFLPFLTARGLKDYFEIRPTEAIGTADLAYGLQGMAIPAFRLRRALEFGLFGSEAGEIKGTRRKTKEDVVVDEQELTAEKRLSQYAARQAMQYHLGPESDAQKRSLELFLKRNASAGIRTILILGQVSPVLQNVLPPEIHADFVKYVQGLSQSGTVDVVVLDEVPRHESGEYGDHDLMHIKPESRDRFTDWLGEQLVRICCKPVAEGTP